MYEGLKNFNQQFLFDPKIENNSALDRKSSFVVVGMGGSAHAAELLKNMKPELDIMVRRDYGLPRLPVTVLQNKLIILSSYSGNTEEVIDAFTQAKEKNLAMAVIATGGKLLALAIENKVPYIKLPDFQIEPRIALGLSIKAFLKLVGEEDELQKIKTLATILLPLEFETPGKELAERMKGCVPVIYASMPNATVAYNWKIKLNETGKIPAFYNVFPELNHNEMNGFSVLSEKFYFIFLRDKADNPKVLKRMDVTAQMYRERNLKVEILDMAGENAWQKIFSSLMLADWVSYHTALLYGFKPDGVPTVEEFKKLIS
jgi:glucose/mannose-6-phosphate isomerase